MALRAQDIIAVKRDGGTLSDTQIVEFIDGYVRGEITDYQAAAFLMAVYVRGMDTAETAALTRAMARSGRMLDLAAAGIPAASPTIDKHSTGGVGDKVSLIVVPILAAAGAFVCKMSGRGLGHTGGTLDKLESIPGFIIGLSSESMMAQVARIGACLAGQTDDLAPADKKLYALRDATATVESLPLIVSSILSKKLAGGAQHFLFDVKVGDGALLRGDEDARRLARALVEGAMANGRKAVAVLSDMDAPLGRAVGNALEIAEAVNMLSPDASAESKDTRLREVCLTLAAEGLTLCGLTEPGEAAREQVSRLLESGAAREKFREIVRAQGGDERVVDDPDSVLPQAPVRWTVRAGGDGYVSHIAAHGVGEIVMSLGGGRARKEDIIDPSVGITLLTTIGAKVAAGEPLATIHASRDVDAKLAGDRLIDMIAIGPTPVSKMPTIREILRSEYNISNTKV